MKNIDKIKCVKRVGIDRDLYNILKAELLFHPSSGKGINDDVMEEYINTILFNKVSEIGNQFSRICERGI